MKSVIHVLGILLLILGISTQALAEDYVGGLRNVQGGVVIIRDGNEIVAESGLRVLQRDIVKTSANGALGIIFKDNTRISLGPDTEVAVVEYVFEPGSNTFSFLTKMAKGTVSYLSGSMGKLSPDSVKFETPVATLGIRGTKFLAKVPEDESGTFSLYGNAAKSDTETPAN